jgi:SAM-dependent methyltransferase
MDVPAPLARGAALLRCPVCGAGLQVDGTSLRCAARHTFDVARQGHVTRARGTVAGGDDAEMVAARAAVLGAGHFAPLTRALVAAAPERRDVVLDVGAGTGQHLAAVLGPDGLGFALDTSRPALRHAVRAHPGVAAIVADVWRALPLGDATVDLVLDVFSPRNGGEMARVLRPGGVALVVIPTPEHLAELAPLHGVRVDPDKVERLERTVGAHLELVDRRPVRWTMDLDARAVERVLAMSPAGAHRHAGAAPRAAQVTGAVELWTFTTRPRSARAVDA